MRFLVSDDTVGSPNGEKRGKWAAYAAPRCSKTRYLTATCIGAFTKMKREYATQLTLPGFERPEPAASGTHPSPWWVAPQHSKTQVDKAGQVLACGEAPQDALENALTIINNWRSCHSYPLNTFQVGLRHNARDLEPKALVAQRIKRLSSIQQKLTALRTQRLSQMQDIGGCRAVVTNVSRVRSLADIYLHSSLKHPLQSLANYIDQPRRSGYRGIHLVYRYHSDRIHTYNGLLVELQLRSQLQHAWATAVETVSIFLRQALKASQGHEQWLRFFSLMGSAIARRERTPEVPDTPKRGELIRELTHTARQLDVQKRLKSYGSALRTLNTGKMNGAHYFLIALDPEAERVWVSAYPQNELERASADYLAMERTLTHRSGAEAVLVSVESIESLRRAYPNYFLDTSLFMNALNIAIDI